MINEQTTRRSGAPPLVELGRVDASGLPISGEESNNVELS